VSTASHTRRLAHVVCVIKIKHNIKKITIRVIQRHNFASVEFRLDLEIFFIFFRPKMIKKVVRVKNLSKLVLTPALQAALWGCLRP
jgi:hypothetical protein